METFVDEIPVFGFGSFAAIPSAIQPETVS
jgi:hypothetical protein